MHSRETRRTSACTFGSTARARVSRGIPTVTFKTHLVVVRAPRQFVRRVRNERQSDERARSHRDRSRARVVRRFKGVRHGVMPRRSSAREDARARGGGRVDTQRDRDRAGEDDDDDDDDEEEEEECTSEDGSERETSLGEKEGEGEGRASEDARASSDCSAVIASRLLRGWVLTNETCPIPKCNTPLVRNRAREMFCARHDMFVRKDERVGAGATAEPPPGTAAAAAAATTTTTTTTTFVANKMSDDIAASERATFEALETKLAHARERLANETDVAKCQALLAFVDQIHASLRALSPSTR